MRHSTYLRYELMRTFRNRRFLLFSLGFPLVLFLTIAGTNKSKSIDGIAFPLYYMTGMVAWGSMIAIISSGTWIAVERQLGWTRQLRITPLRTSNYFGAKIICGYTMALVTVVVLYLAGVALNVRLDAGQWATMTVLLLIGLVPFAILGVMAGEHLLGPDSPRAGGGRADRAVRPLRRGMGTGVDKHHVRRHRQVHPLVLARPVRQGRARRHKLAPCRSLDDHCRVDGGARTPRRLHLTTTPPASRDGAGNLMAMAKDVRAAGPREAEWVADQRRWAQGWRRVVFPAIFLAWLIQVAVAIPEDSHGVGLVGGYVILATLSPAMSWPCRPAGSTTAGATSSSLRRWERCSSPSSPSLTPTPW